MIRVKTGPKQRIYRRLTDEESELVSDYYDFAVRVGTEMIGLQSFPGRDDENRLAEVVHMALVEAVTARNKFDGPLATFIAIVVKRRMIDAWVKATGESKKVWNRAGPLHDEDVIDPRSFAVCPMESEESFRDSMKWCNPSQKEVLRSIYIDDEKHRSIGKRIGLRKTRVSQIHVQALQRVRERLSA